MTGRRQRPTEETKVDCGHIRETVIVEMEGDLIAEHIGTIC